jgi:uracil-DNA glycosylase family 4
MIGPKQTFTSDCRKCARLASFLSEVRLTHGDYFARPVPSFGDPNAQLLVVGLAPGMHGANKTGRPFTGDHAGILLYKTLFEQGFSTAAVSKSSTDNLALRNCRITNAVRCLPPKNKPIGEEINNCNGYLLDELKRLPPQSVVVSLGSVAHSSVLKALKLKQSKFLFAHGSVHKLDSDLMMIDSYHCSRYNTQTRRLTADMFSKIFVKARGLLKKR